MNIFPILKLATISVNINTVKKIHRNWVFLGGVGVARSQFLVSDNLCGQRVRLARAMHTPSLTQEDLARKMNLMGMDMSALILSRIEKNQRNVCDAELQMLSRALNVSMEWLCGETGNPVK